MHSLLAIGTFAVVLGTEISTQISLQIIKTSTLSDKHLNVTREGKVHDVNFLPRNDQQ